LLDDFLTDGSPYFIFLLAALLTGYFAGWRAGGLVSLFSAPLGFYFPGADAISAADWNSLALFLTASAALVWLAGVIDIRDHTVRLTRRRALTAARELDILIDSAVHYAICLLDPGGRVVIWNTGAERLFGWRVQEAVNQPHILFFTKEDRERGEPDKELSEAKRNGQSFRTGTRVRKDGSCFLAEALVTRIDNQDGKLLGFGKVIRDVTEERAQAQAIEARESLLNSILSTVPDAMIMIDEQGIILSFSTAAETLFGYKEEEVVGKNVSLLMPSPDREMHDGYLARYLSTGEKRIVGGTRRVIGLRKDGTTFPHELSVGEARSDGKRLFTGFVRDLTAREAAQEQLRQLQAELIHISRVSAVGTMATTLAHELNQPLAAIANYVQTSSSLLANPDRNSAELVREALEEAGQEALRAGAIVQRLREFVTHGELQRSIEPVERLLDHASTLAFAGGATKGIKFGVDLGDAPGKVLVDPIQIQQVLLNLIRNAVEAVPAGGKGWVRIAAKRRGNDMHFTVSDNGSGIDPNIANSLFEPFNSSKAQGMGIGLSICRTIVEAHGGKIWAEIRPEGGAVFSFTVPCVDEEEKHE
jgi:two-component system sensor kinase FixL